MKIDKFNKKDILTKIDNPIIYNQELFNIDKKYTGKDVKVSIIASGLPTYQGFSTLSDFDVMIDNVDSPHDDMGYTTAIAGFIAANGTCGIHGLAQNTQIYSLKAIENNGNVNYSTLIASILWSIIKNVNIIVIPFEIDISYEPIYSAIKKANKNKITIMSLNLDCKEIYTIIPCHKKDTFDVKIKNKEILLTLPTTKLITSFGDKLFVKVNKKIASLGLATGIMSLLIEKNNSN